MSSKGFRNSDEERDSWKEFQAEIDSELTELRAVVRSMSDADVAIEGLYWDDLSARVQDPGCFAVWIAASEEVLGRILAGVFAPEYERGGYTPDFADAADRWVGNLCRRTGSRYLGLLSRFTDVVTEAWKKSVPLYGPLPYSLLEQLVEAIEAFHWSAPDTVEAAESRYSIVDCCNRILHEVRQVRPEQAGRLLLNPHRSLV